MEGEVKMLEQRHNPSSQQAFLRTDPGHVVSPAVLLFGFDLHVVLLSVAQCMSGTGLYYCAGVSSLEKRGVGNRFGIVEEFIRVKN